MKHISFFLLICCFASTGFAQEVDFEIPTEINIIQGRLSVTFHDSIKEESASRLVQSFGYSILQSVFDNRSAVATSGALLTTDQLNRLKNDKRVVEVQQSESPDVVRSTKLQQDRTSSQFNVIVYFESHITKNESKAILDSVTAINFSFPQKRPNEIVIDVGDEDETALTILNDQHEVKWVTYVGMAGNP